MTQFNSDIAFSPAVKAAQERLGSRAQYQRTMERHDWQDTITPDLQGFIAERDHFYLATASADGQPYIQHRGGPKGFLKPLDERRLAFADFKGNRQYISLGNSSENPKAQIFLIDYANRRRVKIWGTLEAVEDDTDLLARLHDPSYKGRPERVFVFTITAWDVNCPQHITQRFTMEEIGPSIAALKARIAELEEQLDAAREGYIR